MSPSENYLHEVLRILFSNRQLMKRVFLGLFMLTLLVPVFFKQTFQMTGEVVVLSKKLAQADTGASALARDTDKFVPPSLSDMETEANILRSTSLIRQTVSGLVEEGLFDVQPGLLQRWVMMPLKAHLMTPFREHVVNPLRTWLELDTDPVRDTRIDELTSLVQDSLTIETIPGSNVIAVTFEFPDPAMGTRVVNRLLETYLEQRYQLQSVQLPESYFEQKKTQYHERISALESQRLNLLWGVDAADPAQEITFLLDAAQQESQALNQIRDQVVEQERWIAYLREELATLRKRPLTDVSFAFSFNNTLGGVAYEDREIRLFSEQLTELTGRYANAARTYRADSLPAQELKAQIERERARFIQVIENRIRERLKDIEIQRAVMAEKAERVAAHRTRITALQDVNVRIRQLTTEIDALHQAFSGYTQQYEEARTQTLLSAQAQSNARILSHAFEPTEAAFPRAKVVIPLGLITSVLLALAAAFLHEFFDHRFKAPAQIPQMLGLPVLLTLDDQTPPAAPPARRFSLAGLRHWLRH